MTMRTRADVLEHFGWTPCYHNRGGGWRHYNVKVHGDYRALSAALERYDAGVPGRFDILADYAQRVHDRTLEAWRDELAEYFGEVLGYPSMPRVYSCGRSSGYVQVRDGELPLEDMGKFGGFLADSVKWYNGAEYAGYLAADAVDEAGPAMVAALERMPGVLAVIGVTP